MADKPYRAPEGSAKPWNGNYEAARKWWIAVADADAAAIQDGAGKADLVLEHLRVAAEIKGVTVWELVASLTPEERKLIDDRA
jgi:hypothetical protein